MNQTISTAIRGSLPERWALPLALGVTALFYGSLLSGATLYTSDVLPYILGQKRLIRDALWQLQLPLYDPYTLCGTPLLANITAGILYPANLLLLCGSPLWGIHFFVFAHYVGATATLYLFLRRGPGASCWAAALGAVAYSAGGFAWSMADHWFFMALPWLPLFFLGVLRLQTGGLWDGRRGWLQLAVGALVLLLLGGNFQQAYDAVCFGGLLVLVCAFPGWGKASWRTGLRRIAVYAVVVLGAALLAAPQLLPTLQAARSGYRSGGLALDVVQQQSLAPLRLIEFVIPFAGGVKDDYGSVWRGVYGGNFPWTHSLFVGTALLAGLAASLRQGQNRVVRWGWLVLLLGLGLALGRYLPLYRVLHLCLPGFSLFRHPEKYLLWVHLGLCVIGPLGLDNACRGKGARRALSCLAGLTVVTVGVLLGLVAWHLFSPDSHAAWMQAGGSRWAPLRLLRFQLFQGGISLLATLLCGVLIVRRTYGRQSPATACLGPICALTWGHLLLVGTCTQWHIPAEWLRETVTAANWFPESSRCDSRIFVDDTPRVQAEGTADRPLFVQEKLRKYARLGVNIPSLFGLRAASGFSPLAPGPYRDLLDFSRHEAAHIMDLCAVRWLILDGIHEAGAVPAANRIVHQNLQQQYTILENPTAYPRIQVTGQVQQAPDAAAALEAAFALATERHRLKNLKALPPPPAVLSKPASHHLPAANPHDPNLVILRDAPGAIAGTCTGPGWLVVRDWFHDGWRARLDGRQSVEITPVDGHFMGVFVPVGRHTVTLQYRPPGLAAGCVLALMGVLVVSLCWADPLVFLDDCPEPLRS